MWTGDVGKDCAESDFECAEVHFEGEIRVTMSAADGEAQLRVIDTGTGIAETELPHLFQRFRRIDGARRRSHEGSGIGLALVRELVEMHGAQSLWRARLAGGQHLQLQCPLGERICRMGA